MHSALRPHQQAAIDRLRESLREGKRRPVLQAPTGAGKTILSAALVEMALEKGRRVMFTCPAISLIKQTVDKFHREGIQEIGVMQANHPLTNANMPVQVATTQTLAKRKSPEVDMVIVDEAHNQYSVILRMMADPAWTKVPFIGLSATPWARGMGLYWDDLIVVATTPQLIEQGYLVPIEGYAPSKPDLKHVRKQAGDYHEADLAKAMNKPKLIADIVDTWLSLGQMRPTICFAVDCKHAREIRQSFCASGIPAGYIDAHTPTDEREKIGKQLECGELKVVTSVGCLIVGLDWTFVSCIIHARPTQSEMIWVQSVGRGLRTHPGKSNCILLDHASNYLNLGFPEHIHYDSLDTTRKGERQVEREKKHKYKKPRECPSCSFQLLPSDQKCPICGYEMQVISSVENDAGSLVDVVSGKARKGRIYDADEKELWYAQLRWIAYESGYKNGWADHKFKEKFKHWPEKKGIPPTDPSPEVLSFVRSRQIAFAKKKRAPSVAEVS